MRPLLHPPLVLAYHGIGTLARELDPHNLMVAPERFRAQVEAVKRRGYAFVTLTDFARRMAAGGPHERVCALTFDDGSADNVEVLPGLLAELGAPATVFVCPGLLGRPDPFFPPAAGVRLMDGDEVRRLAADPLFELGSHTNTHVDLSRAGEEEAYRELASSRAALAELVAAPVTSFAYPGCAYSPACPGAAERAGYEVAVTCGPRGGWSPFELRRESVDSFESALTFALKSRGLYWALWGSAPGRLGRRALRRFRHSA